MKHGRFFRDLGGCALTEGSLTMAHAHHGARMCTTTQLPSWLHREVWRAFDLWLDQAGDGSVVSYN